jgi:hypothetical protein
LGRLLAADELTAGDIDGVTHLLSSRATSVSENTLARPLELLEGISSRDLGLRLAIGVLARRLLLILLILLVAAVIAPLLQPRGSLTELTKGKLSCLLGKLANLTPESTTAMTAATSVAAGIPRGPAATVATVTARAAITISARPVISLGLRLLGLLTSNLAGLASFAPLTDP